MNRKGMGRGTGTGEKKSTGPVLLMGPPADTAWIRYITQFEAPDPVFALWSRAGVDLLVSPMEAGRAARGCAGRRSVCVHTADRLGVSRADRARPFAALFSLLKMRRVRAVRVSAWFPAYVARRLEEEGITVQVESGGVSRERETKTAAEVAHIRRAQRAAVKAMREAVRMIRSARIDPQGRLRHGAGRMTSEAVRARIAQVLTEAGCREEGTIVAGGRQAADPHARGHGPLRSGEAIVLDIFPRDEETGYYGDLTRTVVRGRPDERLVEMYAAVKAAQARALARIAPRVSFRSVHAAAQAELDRRGFRTRWDPAMPAGFIHGTGHGIGLEVHEIPSLNSRAAGRLKAGHVVTVEPGLYYRDVGGIRIEDTVVVTAQGARILAPLSRTFLLDGGAE